MNGNRAATFDSYRDGVVAAVRVEPPGTRHACAYGVLAAATRRLTAAVLTHDTDPEQEAHEVERLLDALAAVLMTDA